MEMWDLFLKGLAKTFEEFALKMIEKGKEEKGDPIVSSKPRWVHPEPNAQGTEKRPVDSHTDSMTDVRIVKERVQQSLLRHPEGLTMKDIANDMDVQWHFLRVPVREMLADGQIEKNGLLYGVPGVESEAGESVTPVSGAGKPVTGKRQYRTKPAVNEPSGPDLEAQTAAFLKSIKAELVYPKSPEEKTTEPQSAKETSPAPSETPVEPERPDQKHDNARAAGAHRRRVVDATQLERKSKPDAAPVMMANRDLERMRYRIMTALRGRPEGLTLDKLAVVVGMEADSIRPIISELQSESKVIITE